MKIDGNELATRQNELSAEGRKAEAEEMKQEFLRQVNECGDHCSCPEACNLHGKCKECVAVHRGHRDHLPYCFWSMVNESVAPLLRMTEGSACE